MKQKLTHIFFAYIFFPIFLLGAFCAFFLPSVAQAQSIKSFDSIAGYGTEVIIEGGEENASLNILMVSPLQKKQVTKYSFSLNSQGKSSVIIPPKDTTQSGIYRFVVVKKHQFYADGIEHSFTIFPDEPSFSHSQFFILDDAVETGKKSKGTAILYDTYQNPIEGHRLKISSSRNQDRIIFDDGEKTNSNGEVSFFITSHSAGSSQISIEDNTAGGLFSQSPSLRFYKNLSSSLSADITSATSAADLFGNISRFEIEFPDTVTADSDESYLTLRVLDSDGNIVKNFIGTVKIMIPTDKNAIVPGQEGVYTFLEKDQGEILFSRSVVFPEKGKHSLEIYAYDKILDELNYNIFAKKTITVEEKQNNNNNADKVLLLSPSDKSTFAVSDIPVRGTALANSNIKIVLDENPILEAEVDEDGKFIALLKNVSEGDHLLYVYQKEDSSQKSEEISFLIDTKVSGIISSSFNPHISKPGGDVEVTVIVEDEKDIKSLDVFWNGKTEKAKPVGKNTYQLSFSAPQKEGNYPIKISVTDNLQNSISSTLSPDLLVKKDVQPLGDIKNLKASYNQKTKILHLSWDALKKKPLLYVIHSGVSKISLKKIKSVSSKITMANLPDLSPGKYFFSVSAVNTDGSEGKKSTIIEYTIIIPTPTPTPTPTSTPTSTPTPTPTLTPTPTPTLAKPTPTAIPEPQFFLTPQGNSLQSSWEKGIPLFWEKYPKSEGYRISYGLASRSYAADFDVPNYMTSSRIKDLIPGVRYFVLLESLDARGNVIFSYKEHSAIPLEGSFHPAPTPRQPYPEWVSETGPRLFLFLGGLFLFCSAWYITRREENIV